jgi:hypothetical protein
MKVSELKAQLATMNDDDVIAAILIYKDDIVNTFDECHSDSGITLTDEQVDEILENIDTCDFSYNFQSVVEEQVRYVVEDILGE